MDKDRSPVYLVRDPVTSGGLAGVLGHTFVWAGGVLPTTYKVLRPQSRALDVCHIFPLGHFRSTAADAACVCTQLLSLILALVFFFFPFIFLFLSVCWAAAGGGGFEFSVNLLPFEFWDYRLVPHSQPQPSE